MFVCLAHSNETCTFLLLQIWIKLPHQLTLIQSWPEADNMDWDEQEANLSRKLAPKCDTPNPLSPCSIFRLKTWYFVQIHLNDKSQIPFALELASWNVQRGQVSGWMRIAPIGSKQDTYATGARHKSVRACILRPMIKSPEIWPASIRRVTAQMYRTSSIIFVKQQFHFIS